MENVAIRRRVWQSLPAITLVALALRLIAIRFNYTDTWNSYRSYLLFGFEIGRIARSIAAGHGYGNPMLVETGPTAWMTPIYPYLLAAVFKLFGIYSRTSAFVILALNSLFSSLVCIPVYFAAKRSFGSSIAIVAGWMWALWPYSIYISSAFVWETCLSALLLAVVFAWTLKLKQEQPDKWNWLGYGVLWGFSVLANASILSLFPFLAAWALYPVWRHRSRWFATAALVVLGIGVAVLPWQVRNYRTFHQPIPLRDNFWLEVWLGNDGNTGNWVDIASHPSVNDAELAKFVRLGEIPYMQQKRREALGIIAEHPALYLLMCLRRFVYTWTGFWNLDPTNLEIEFHNPANVYLTTLISVVTLMGLWLALRNSREAAVPYLLVLIIYPLLFYLTHPEIRYRHLIEPEMIVLAAVGVRFLVAELFKGFPGLQRAARGPV